jgi:hypothetical protein
MENYIKNYGLYNKKIVYDFKLGYGGIGDNIKFFMFVLESCMQNNTALYYKINNIDNEKYIKLKYNIMYVNESRLKELDTVTVVTPYMYYKTINSDYSININEVFYFSDEVKVNSKILFPENITDYVSIHLRLGDKYLETETKYVVCKYDERRFSEENVNKFIEEHSNENIFFCCDNSAYKLKLKEKYNNIIITNCQIGHTSLSNTTSKQVLDGITEFYILTNSKKIFAASTSGFSIIASKFNNIPLLSK